MDQTPLLYSSVTGSGPVVVLLHGFLANSLYWSRVARKLESRYTVVRLDLLGFGQSPKPMSSQYTYDAHVASIHQTLKYLHIQGPVIFMGHSMGALLALRYARVYPAAVSKLILSNMPILLDRKQAKKEILSTNLIYRLGFTPLTERATWFMFKHLSLKGYLPAPTSGHMPDRNLYLFQHTPVSRMRTFRNIIIGADIQSDLAAINVGTTLVCGLQDSRSTTYLRNLPQLILKPNIVVKKVVGDHHIPYRQPELLASLIQE